MTRPCPRATGRHPMRRKKNCVFVAVAALTLFFLVQMNQLYDGYSPLQPLSDAKSEAKRLLRFITHYHIQCNSTLQIGNRSHWPICVERDIGIDLDVKDGKVSYTVGSHGDFLVERDLAQNHSVEVIVIAHDKVPNYLQKLNNTHVVQTVLVPNDPADFSRNLYGQQTINDIQASFGHKILSLLRLGSTATSSHMWEVLKFMIEDHFLANVQQLHVAMYIDKLDDDFLYNWYRVLYELFYKGGFRLYHTSSADSLCLQVTMMESCVYYMSFVKNPGTRVFVVHPPADFGTSDLEEERILDYIGTVQTDCKQQIIGGPNDEQLSFTSPQQPQWQVCTAGMYKLFEKPCSVYRFRLENDHSLEQKFIKEGCSVHTVEPMFGRHNMLRKYRTHAHYPAAGKQSSPATSEAVSVESVMHQLSQHGPISLLEVDAPGHEWDVLGQLLDSGILTNVSQLVTSVRLQDETYGRHHTILRSRYSELRRIEAQGFQLFYSAPEDPAHWLHRSHSEDGHMESCCFKLGFVRNSEFNGR